MTDNQNIIELPKIGFEDNNQGRKTWPCLAVLCQISYCPLVQIFCNLVDNLWLLLDNSPLKHLWRNKNSGANTVLWSRMHFNFTKFVLLLEDIVVSLLFILIRTFPIQVNLGETLGCRTRTLFSPNLPVMWCTVRLVHNWDSDKRYLTGIETQHLFPTVI